MVPVIHIFGLNLYPYGLMIGIGIISAVLLFIKRCKNRGYNEEWAFNLAVLAVIAGLVGAKLLYIITVLPDIIKNPSLLISEFNSGFVIYGGVIGGVLMGYWYARNRKWSFLKMFDIAAPLLAMAQGFGRIGCLFAGCCYGKETDFFFGIQFDHSPYAPNHVSLIPTQAISSLGDFAIAGVLFWFDNRRKKKDGHTGSLYLVLYSIGRFIIEIFRDDPRGSVFNILSTSQFICIFIFIAGIILFLVSSKNFKAAKEGIAVSCTAEKKISSDDMENGAQESENVTDEEPSGNNNGNDEGPEKGNKQ